MGRCLIENATRYVLTSGAEMRRRIKLTTRRELAEAISHRYQAADRNSKRLILDEFIKVTGYHRKHAIRVLTAHGDALRERPAARRRAGSGAAGAGYGGSRSRAGSAADGAG